MRIEGHKVRLEQKNGAKSTYIKVALEFCVPPNHEMIVQGTFEQSYWNTVRLDLWNLLDL